MGQNIMSQDIMEQDIIGQNISKELVAQWSEDFRRLTGGRSPVGNSLSRAGLRTVAMNPQAFRENPRVFSQELPAGPAQDQRKSGRCWIFAGLNFLRQKAVEKHGLKDIVFSASYLSFWSNLEKSNYVLEIILETRDDDLEDPVVRWILANPLNDGGQWEMLCDLIDKYGAAPESAMPENYQSGDSRDMTRCIITKLRQSACLLRRQSRQGASLAELRRQKAAFLREIYGMLCFFLGEPPQHFDYEYRDAKGQFHRLAQITPPDFYRQMAGISLRDYVSLVHVPMSDKRFSTLYTVKYLGNVWEGEPIHYLNLEMPTIKELVLRQLSDGEGVWFGSDISHMCDRETGMMVRNLFQLAETLGADLAMDKGQRLDYHESRLNHAMVIRGVNIVDGRPNRWKVENSWGKEVGDEGYFLMDDGWFDEFVYQAAIHKKYLPADLLALLRQPATVLRPWDPLGSLAGMSGR